MPNGCSRTVVIDCHCHTFNARDMPVKGFLYKVALNADEKVHRKLILPLANFLAELTENAPKGEKELEKLKTLLDPAANDYLVGIAATEDNEADEEQFANELKKAIYVLEQSDEEGDQTLLSAIEDEAGITKDEIAISSAWDVAKKILGGPGVLARYVKWISLLTKYRFEVTKRLIDTYTDDGEAVDLFTPALIDYDLWVNDKAKTKLPIQIRLMEGNIQMHRGQIHPFFPFDPWRESQANDTEDGSLHWLKKAIEECGFIGAKLYPPMGYSATGNANHTKFPKKALKQKTPEAFGAELDQALEKLYKYCEKKDVPILTHCADSNETEEGFGERSHPKYWEDVVNQHPELHVNLGHFGGLDTLSSNNGWAWKVGELLNDSTKHVYSDISHYAAILDDEHRQKTIDNLMRLFARYPNAKDRIIFGTDWIMLARVKDHKRFLKAFRDAYKEAFGPDQCNKFMGLNAANFLGLSQGQKTRERLDAFYEKHSMGTPAWAQCRL